MVRSSKTIPLICFFICMIICISLFHRNANQYVTSPNNIFKYKALNDSLNLFIVGANDVPKANYPTSIYIYAFQRNNEDFVQLQSFPGYELFLDIDTSVVFWKRGVYRDKYITIYTSQNMQYVFSKKGVRQLQLNHQDSLILKSKPYNFGELDDYYRRWKEYKITDKKQIELTWISLNNFNP